MRTSFCKHCGGSLIGKRELALFCSARCRNKAYSDNHKTERQQQDRAYGLRARYGITVEQWETLFCTQGRRCAICGTDSPGGRGWHTDHSHESGAVRGILCFSCNVGLGRFNDSADLLLAAADYLGR